MNPDANSAPASAATARALAKPGDLPLVTTVGFSGHRAIEDSAEADRLIGEALAAVGAAFQTLQQAQGEAFAGSPGLRLLVGAAPGTDRIIAAAWRGARLGEVHLIYPFREPAGDAAFTDDPVKADPETRVETPPAGEAWTGIDSVSLGLDHQRAHAEVGRWIIRHADLLVAWWNGEPPAGPGGAGDTVRRALDRGLPVVWLQPGQPHPRVVDPARLHQHADAAEMLTHLAEIAEPLDAERLAAVLAPALAPPGDGVDDAETNARRDYAAVDPMRRRSAPLGLAQALLDRTLWRSFALFEAMTGGVRAASDERLGGPPSLAAQPGFQRLAAASRAAAERSTHLSSIHRSEQLLLIIVAILAVLTGALPALFEDPRQLANAHALSAGVEFGLGLFAFILVSAARRAHRHRRWSDGRRLAERLRAARATWPLGFDIADAQMQPAATWTEWRARAVLRAAGPPRGWIDRPRFDAEAAWVASQLIGGQIDYHARQHRIAENIERFVQRVESVAVFGLMGMLLAYLLLSGQAWITHGPRPSHLFGGWVMVVSAVSPAIGAGCLALEATNGFGELARHSQHLEVEFGHLRERLGQIDHQPYHHVQSIIRRAAQLVVEDADAWRDRALRRRLVRGG
jgi:hypothetical protein